MKTSGYFMIFYLTFFDIWDLSASQNSRNESKTHTTATGVYVTAWEGQVTLSTSNSSSHESITHTTLLLRAPFTTTGSQNTPVPTSGPCGQFAGRNDAGLHRNAGCVSGLQVNLLSPAGALSSSRTT
ncbi:uncharacterized protein tmem123 isoform X2 [Pangasianodon hypophthalmus]|uniref:uncharacterized protein tmem123 isoform X2 n=1 Tax=Pangasianodon hypophthalmus TaxID=310915 RepID=UPI002307190E|nr:uncharacterized protein tmem123 isoform X2 [Pangasianodon hypophthalmus]